MEATTGVLLPILIAILSVAAALAALTFGMIRSLRSDLWQQMDSLDKRQGERLDSVNTRIDGVNMRIDGVDKRLDGVNKSLGERIDGVDKSLGKRIDGLDKRLDGFERRMDSMGSGIDTRFQRLEDRLRVVEHGFAELGGSLATIENYILGRTRPLQEAREVPAREAPAE